MGIVSPQRWRDKPESLQELLDPHPFPLVGRIVERPQEVAPGRVGVARPERRLAKHAMGLDVEGGRRQAERECQAQVTDRGRVIALPDQGILIDRLGRNDSGWIDRTQIGSRSGTTEHHD